METKDQEQRQEGRPEPKFAVWRRLALAVPISVLVHLLLVLVTRPEYVEVADYAIELEVVEATPGPPPTTEDPPDDPVVAPEPEPEPEPIPEPEPEEEPPTKMALVDDPVVTNGPDGGSAPADSTDGGPSAIAALEGDGGPGEGTGICFHDIFPYAQEDPSWVLWVSMSSFNDTVYEEGLARTLGSFKLYKDMAGATGMDPYNEVEGFLVTAQDFADWRTYGVVATYNSGEALMKTRLQKSRGDRQGFSWTETTAGYEGALPGAYRWHLVGSGRVLAVRHEPRKPAPSTTDGKSPSVADGGTPTQPEDGGITSAPPPLPPPGHPEWPRQVSCMGAPEKGNQDKRDGFRDVVRAHISPDPEGHWPVAIIATNDPGAVGIGRRGKLPAKFRWAVMKAFFSDPIRLEGKVSLEGDAKQIETLAATWRSMVSRAGADPFMKLAGLGGVFDDLTMQPVEDGIEFTMPMTESQIQAALLFLQLQGEQLDEMINRKTRNKAKPNRPVK